MIPDNICDLARKVQQNEREMELVLRKGNVQERVPYDIIASHQEIEAMWNAWCQFHKEIEYAGWGEFYSKESFSQNILTKELSLEKFIQLICDRTFLFLQYSDNLKNPNYPTYEETVKMPQRTSNWFDPEKIHIIEKNAFMPTYALKREWIQWKKRVETLQQELEQRQAFIRRGLLSSYNIQIANPKRPPYPTDLETKLIGLLESYLVALGEFAYKEEEYKEAIQGAGKHALPWIHAVLEETERNCDAEESECPCVALLMWSLFIFPTKLATGKLKKYNFQNVYSKYLNTRKKSINATPHLLNGNQSMKSRCDIILFDHLLDLLPPSDKDYAKFQFYAFSRLDRFTHYQTIAEKYKDFNCVPDMADGIDRLGNLIRYNIEHCLMDTPAWLQVAAPNHYSKPLLNSLTELLLHDSTLLPVKRRLTDRIRIFLNDSEGKREIERYKLRCSNPDAISKFLDRVIEQKNLHFQTAHVFLNESSLNDPNIAQCERFVLEHALKQSAFKEYYQNLRQKAKMLVPSELFLSEHVFDD